MERGFCLCAIAVILSSALVLLPHERETREQEDYVERDEHRYTQYAYNSARQRTAKHTPQSNAKLLCRTCRDEAHIACLRDQNARRGNDTLNEGLHPRRCSPRSCGRTERGLATS